MEREVQNTLVNVTPGNPVYRWEMERSLNFVERAIKELEVEIDPNMLTTEEGLPLLVAGTDAYFIHYTTFPLLRKTVNEELEFLRQSFEEYMASNNYKHIHALTMLDRDLSDLYRYNLLKELLRELVKNYTINRNKGQNEQQALRNAVREAVRPEVLKRAAKKTGEIEAVAPLVGKEPGRFERLLRIQRRRVVNLKKIVDLSRKISMDVKARRKMTPSPMGYVEGYRTTKKLERAIARELALPEELFLAKITTNGLTAWDRRTLRRGAYYVVIDKSGSMSGEKTEWARAVALAILDKAMAEGAEYYLRFFDTAVYPDKPARNPADVAELVATVASNGGTDIDAALRTALRDLRGGEYDTETIILITDGEDNVGTMPDVFKEAGVRLVAVMVQGENESLRRIAKATGGEYLSAELTREGALKLISLL